MVAQLSGVIDSVVLMYVVAEGLRDGFGKAHFCGASSPASAGLGKGQWLLNLPRTVGARLAAVA
jgi:hypothetical protein